MKRLIAVLLLLVAFAAHAADRTVIFKDAELTLTDAACEPKSELKAGNVVFKDSREPRKVCWIEQDGLIWVLDGLSVFSFPADNAKSKGVAI
jgi:hypothetical protein